MKAEAVGQPYTMVEIKERILPPTPEQIDRFLDLLERWVAAKEKQAEAERRRSG